MLLLHNVILISQAKASGKKLQRVSLAVSLKGIRMTDLATEEDQLQVSIYRYVSNQTKIHQGILLKTFCFNNF